MANRRVLTLHPPIGKLVYRQVLDALGEVLPEHGITRWWPSPEALPDIVIMADTPDEPDQESR